ncbi:MAG: CopD family protein [Nitrospiraceae bacterium]|nr:CopD family protein [Nitrospiraceae bacterium]
MRANDKGRHLMISVLHVIPGWFELISLAFCIGVLVCRIWVFPPSADTASTHGDWLAGMWRWFGIGVGVMIACTTSNLFVRAVEMSGLSFFSVFPILPVVLFRTHFGRVWIIRIAAEILLLISLKVFGQRRDSRVFLVFMLVLAGTVAATESASGHSSDAGDFSLPEITDLLHLLAISIWGGGLLVLSIFLLPEIVKPDDDRTAPRGAGIALRFSRIAGFAVGIVAITALYNGYLYVGSFEALWKSTYGLIVIAKTGLFLLLVNFGAFNRYVSVPLLQEWAGASPQGRGVITRTAFRLFPRLQLEGNGGRVASRFMRSVKVEAVLIVVLLLCAALLRHEVPAIHLHHMGHADGKPMHMHPGER